jgi:uncharacterized protein
MLASTERGALSALMMLVVTACASPVEHFYLLETSAAESASAVAKGSTVLVGPVVIPAEIDRPQIVVRARPHEVTFNEQERWAVSLKEALTRMIAQDLSRHAKNTRFVPIVSGVYATPKAHLAIDVARFEMSYEAGATVALHWVYRSNAKNVLPLEGDVVARSPIENRGIEGLLDALRRTMAQATVTLAMQLPDES